jgi:two-component system, chemotaxis family, protein-glutamate methylesterase/glutaminase
MVNPPAPPAIHLPARIDSVVIGASAGAIDALSELLPLLPQSTPWPVVVVVHLPASSPSLLAPIFSRKCALPAREPQDKEPVTPGIWFAPPDYHLLIEAERSFALSIDPLVNHSRPSIDVLFESAADVYREALVAIVLTGANDDGAAGAKVIRDLGGFVIVQEPTTAEAPWMPRAAFERAEPQWVASAPEIGRALRDAALRSKG